MGHDRHVLTTRASKMLASQRALFEMPRQICYLNSASYSPLPLRTQEAARAAVGRKATPWTLEPSFANNQHERARAAAARLIQADPADMALIPSISYGVATVSRPEDGDWTSAVLAAIERSGAPPVCLASISSVH